MKVIDTHCDALWKLQRSRRKIGFNHPLAFSNSPEIETNFNRLQAGGVKVQFFAIFIGSSVPSDEMWQHALEQIDLFQTEVIGKNKQMKQIKLLAEVLTLKDDEVGAVLTLEGADCVGNDLMKLRLLYESGVLSIGLTWNHANLCGDGALESRGAGLTDFGKRLVALNNQHGILTDISHVSFQGACDVLREADFPIASHSNVAAVCQHPRNLQDELILEMIKKEAPLHLVFYPSFINQGRNDVTMTDILRHIDYICALGGEKIIGFGSDFDGVDDHVSGLKSARDYPQFVNELLKHYTEEQVVNFTSANFIRYINKYHDPIIN